MSINLKKALSENESQQSNSITHCRLIYGHMQEHHTFSDTLNCKGFNLVAKHTTKQNPPPAPDENSILLFAVRHGTSTWNVAKGLRAKLSEMKKFDSPLNEEGKCRKCRK